jgi:Rv0078B-related antitoxin
LRLALTMQVEGTLLMKENLRRRHPRASEAELDALLERWLLDRPPDAPDRRVPWPRRRSRAA